MTDIGKALHEVAAKASLEVAKAEEAYMLQGAKTVAKWWTTTEGTTATWHMQAFPWKPTPELMQAFEAEIGQRCEWTTWEVPE